MPINLVSGIRPVELADPLEYQAKQAGLRNLMQQSVLNEERLRSAKFEREQAETAANDERNLRSLIAGKPAATDSEIIGAGGVRAGSTYLKSRSDAAKAKADLDKTLFEGVVSKATRKAQILSSATDQASFVAAIHQSFQEGLTTKEQAEAALSTPWGPEVKAHLEQMGRAELDYAKRVELDFKSAEEQRKADLHPTAVAKAQADLVAQNQKNTGTEQIQPFQRLTLDAQAAQRKQQADQHAASILSQEKQGALNRAVQVRGQDITANGQQLTDARARELQADRLNNKPANGAERTALGFYLRATEADKSLESFESIMQQQDFFEQLRFKHGANWMLSKEMQSYRAAQRAFTEARLRRDSGAAIPDHEFENDSKTYFPEPGDSVEVLEQKRAGRFTIRRALRIASGRAIRDIGEEPGDLAPRGPAPNTPGAPAAPPAGTPPAAPGAKPPAGGKRIPTFNPATGLIE